MNSLPMIMNRSCPKGREQFPGKKIAIAKAPANQALSEPPGTRAFLMKFNRILLPVAAAAGLTAGACAQQTTLRVGHFPNITHAQALVASQLSREGKGWFEERLGKDVKIEWFVYNAGPSAMEALAANSIDLTYVGPNPALNLYVKSQGDKVAISSGE